MLVMMEIVCNHNCLTKLWRNSIRSYL